MTSSCHEPTDDDYECVVYVNIQFLSALENDLSAEQLNTNFFHLLIDLMDIRPCSVTDGKYC